MRSAASPCPLDQISIICFKRCPYLRSYVTDIIHSIWKSHTVPLTWKKACTILIHKKGDTDVPSNFRPITLQSVPLKIFTSCLQNAIFKFLSENNYIEHEIQKGFTPKVSGTLEHTTQMSSIINKARIKQRSLVITLLDLKNAFGEVHHNLIYEVLKYHHIPDHISHLVKSLYSGFHTSVITSDFHTSFIPVRRGVLQGDCLSPLLFNLCFNIFIQHIKAPNYLEFGFLLDCCKNLNPVHWFQFVDDAAVISGQESENQHLLNRFTIWCKWSQMVIRVDKCVTFGIKKSATRSIQYLPKLLVNTELVPCVRLGDSFRYLGRYFDFDMSNIVHKQELSQMVGDIMYKIDLLPLHPRNKCQLYSRYLLSKISWHLTVADLTKTWVSQNFDNLVNKYFRSWLDLPISGTLSNVFLPRSKCGLSIQPPSIKHAQCQIVLRNALKSSRNEAINTLWKTTATSTNIQYDQYKSTKEVLKCFHLLQETKLKDKLFSQGSFFRNMIELSLSSLNSLWSSAQSKLPTNIFNFSVKYINNTLPTQVNLHRWGLSSSSDCSFCLVHESLLHVVSGCKVYLQQGRYTWRHDSILLFIAKSFQSLQLAKIFADIPGYISPSVLTGDDLRPDLLISISEEWLYILELTVGFESNLSTNAERKAQKYRDLVLQQSHKYANVKFINLSMSALGIFDKSTSDFLDMLTDLHFDTATKNYIERKLTTIAIRTSYYIFCGRNKEWPNPELLSY